MHGRQNVLYFIWTPNANCILLSLQNFMGHSVFDNLFVLFWKKKKLGGEVAWCPVLLPEIKLWQWQYHSKTHTIRYQMFVVFSNLTGLLYFVPNILLEIPVSLPHFLIELKKSIYLLTKAIEYNVDLRLVT